MTPPRIRLVPTTLGSIPAWRTICLDCGYMTMPMTERRAEMVRRVHKHRHTMGYIGTSYAMRTLT